MKAAILHGAHDFRIEDIKTPDVGEYEYLIKVKACGVCHSELHQWADKIKDLEYPRHIGHEVSGVVIKAGTKAKKFVPGERVAVWVEGKGYAEETAADEKFVFPIADGISFEEALAEPIGCTTNGVLKTKLGLQENIAVVGAGFMGLILIQELKNLNPAKIIAVDVREEMLDMAKELGADFTFNPMKVKVEAEIAKLTDKKGVDIAFEAGGNENTLNLAADITRMEGKLVIFGFHPGPRKIKDLGYWNWMAFDIVNAHFRNRETIIEGTRKGMDLVNSGKLNMKPLITHRFPLKDIEKAFLTAHEKPKGFVKAVITIE